MVLDPSRDNDRKARTVVGRGEEGPLCDLGSELPLGGSTRVGRGKTNGMKKFNKNKKKTSVGACLCVIGVASRDQVCRARAGLSSSCFIKRLILR